MPADGGNDGNYKRGAHLDGTCTCSPLQIKVVICQEKPRPPKGLPRWQAGEMQPGRRNLLYAYSNTCGTVQ